METVVSILRRVIEIEHGDLSPGAAEAILQFQFPESDRSRISDLASRSNHGSLTPAEMEEYDAYIATADLISLWKSKARLSLKRHSTAV